jgi:hypothetical protein
MHRKFPEGRNPSADKEYVYSSFKSKIILPNGGYESFIKTILFVFLFIYYSLNSGFFGI